MAFRNQSTEDLTLGLISTSITLVGSLVASAISKRQINRAVENFMTKQIEKQNEELIKKNSI